MIDITVTSMHDVATEELIVAYLDGELHDPAVETGLFGRLAAEESARQLLREHLVMRGAIQASAQSPQFLLTADVDARTRAKLEALLPALQQVPTEPSSPSEKKVLPERLAPSRSAVRLEPTKIDATRSKRWSFRPANAIALLFLVMVGTWFTATNVGRNTDQQIVAENTVATDDATQSNTAATEPQSGSAELAASTDNITPSTPTVVAEKQAVREDREVAAPRTVARRAAATNHLVAQVEQPKQIAQNVQTEQHEMKQEPEIMISQRFPKLLKTTNVVNITRNDRMNDDGL